MSRFGCKWCIKEEQKLLEIIKYKTISETAVLLKRTNGSIKQRLLLISYRMYNDGHEINEIITKTKITEKNLIGFLNKQNKLKKKRNKENINISYLKDKINLQNKIIKLLEENKELNLRLDLMNIVN
jgi:hypothetical protein